MDYIIALLEQNCWPAGYLSYFLSGKKLGMVCLTLDSTSYKLTPMAASMFVSPGSGQSATRFCCPVLVNASCHLVPGQCGLTGKMTVSHQSRVASAISGASSSSPTVPRWAAHVPKSSIMLLRGAAPK